jgi:hypothetical protein
LHNKKKKKTGIPESLAGAPFCLESTWNCGETAAATITKQIPTMYVINPANFYSQRNVF